MNKIRKIVIIIKKSQLGQTNIKMLFFFLGKNVFWSIEIFDLLTYNVIWYFIDKYT